MKSKEEITEMAKTLCPHDDTECAIFISGFIAGFRAAEKEFENEQDRK